MNNDFCPREEALSRRHDGELHGDELLALESHLQSCLDCSRYEQKLRRLDDLLRTPSAMAGASSRRDRRFRWWRMAPLPLAAAAVAVVAVLSTSPKAPAGPAPSDQPLGRQYQVAAPDGGAYKVVVQGDAQLISIEVNGTVANFHDDKEI